MKKIVSLMLVAVMMICSLAVNVSAAGTIYFEADFSSDTTFSNHFFPEAYFAEDGCAVGYSGARALQAKQGWLTYDVEFNVTIDEDELYTGTDKRTVSFVYLNSILSEQGLAEERTSIAFCVNVTDGTAGIVANDFAYGDESEMLVGPIPFEVKDGTEYNFGVSVTTGRIRVFSDNKLILDFVDSANTYNIGGPAPADFEPDILLWWNTGNTLMYSSIKVASPEYFYPATPVANVTTTPKVTTTAISQVVVTDEDGKEVTDEDGNKITDTVILTEAPADTNTGAALGGNASSTGDTAFIVVALMVASLGCALIVKKVCVK